MNHLRRNFFDLEIKKFYSEFLSVKLGIDSLANARQRESKVHPLLFCFVALKDGVLSHAPILKNTQLF